jgi:hypothetical protein
MSAAGVADAVKEQLRGKGPHGRGILGDDGDPRIDQLGERDVVKPDVRNGSLHPHGSQRHPGSHGQQVLGGEDRGRGGTCHQQVMRGLLGRLRGVDVR